MTRILELVEEHDRQRARGLNLVASETWVSPDVRRALGSDLAGRYAHEFYGGSERAVQVKHRTEALARELFDVDHAFVTPLSGNVCDLALIHGFTGPGDEVAMVPWSHHGYPMNLDVLHRERVAWPMVEDTPQIDVGALEAFYRDHPVPLGILGSSLMPFPHPVEEAVAEAPEGTVVAYDGAHVLGLIATGAFQSPLATGADLLVGSTHKSLPGPQGGLALTNDDDVAEVLEGLLELDVERGIGLVDNPHPHRIAALGVALEELRERPTYGADVVENSKTLARALDQRGVPVRFPDLGYTESHQVVLDLAPDDAQALCHDLATVGIYVDALGRVGTAEATWRGLGPEAMEETAEIVAEVHRNGPREDQVPMVDAIARRQDGYEG